MAASINTTLHGDGAPWLLQSFRLKSYDWNECTSDDDNVYFTPRLYDDENSSVGGGAWPSEGCNWYNHVHFYKKDDEIHYTVKLNGKHPYTGSDLIEWSPDDFLNIYKEEYLYWNDDDYLGPDGVTKMKTHRLKTQKRKKDGKKKAKSRYAGSTIGGAPHTKKKTSKKKTSKKKTSKKKTSKKKTSKKKTSRK